MAKSKPAAKKVPARSAPKKKGKPTLVDRLVNWQVPADVAGLSRPWKGMAVDERAHALLGCGFPRMLLALDEPLAELTGYDQYNKLWGDKFVIPRALAPIRQAIEENSIPSAAELDNALRRGKGAPLAEAVERLFKYGKKSMWTLEVVYGSEAVAEAVVKHLAGLPALAWHGYDKLGEKEAQKIGAIGLDRYGYMTIAHLAWVLHRVPAATATRLRKQLAAVLEKARDPDGDLRRAGQTLDLILNGRKAVQEWGSNFNGELHLSDLVHAHDDPDWVAAMAIAKLAKLKPADRAFFDIQLAVVGGPKVLAALRKSTGAFKKDQAKKIEDQLSLCA